MFSHVNLGTDSLETAVAFYSAVLAPLGLVQKFHEPENGWAAWKAPNHDRPLLIVNLPLDGKPHVAGNGQMIAFQAETREQVDAAYARGIDMGASDEGAPGLRPHYHPDYYGAYFRDLDGNKICVCCHATP